MPDRATTLKKLDTIRLIAGLDLLLLVVLVFCSLTDRRGGVQVLGPIHGVVFLGLLYLTVVGAGEKRWGWWFPLTTVVPLFALIADSWLRRGVQAQPA